MLCALTNGRVASSKLALSGAPPPQATQALPRLSLCLHACAGTVCASKRRLSSPSPLPLLSTYEYEERGVRHRRRRRRWRRRQRRRRRLRSECAGGRGGVAHARARPTAAATGRCVSTSRLVVVVVVSDHQWSVCVRSRRTCDARVTREWHPRNTTRRCAALRCAVGARRSALGGAL